jgi:hypothetical protein
MILQAFLRCNCPEYGLSRDTAQGEKHRYYGHNCDSERGGVRETPTRAFSKGGTTDAAAAMASNGQQRNIAMPQRFNMCRGFAN